MKTFFKFLAYLLVWAVIACVVIMGAVALDFSLESGIWAAAGIFGLWLIFIIIRKLIIRFRAKRRVKALINEKSPEPGKKAKKIKGTPTTASAALLKKQFKNFIAFLNKSVLRKKGDPVYVLPWYLMIGLPGSGKTSALNNAELSAPLFENNAVTGEGCYWYPYNQAVIFDMPGNYVLQADPIGRSEWLQLLTLFEKFRGREPLNGIVITIPADRLLNEDPRDLLEYGRQHRVRIDEVMQFFKINLPVYLLISKCDLIEGFQQWCSILPESSLSQAAGYSRNTDDEISVFIPKAVNYIVENIKDLLLVTAGTNFRLLRLPANIEGIRDGLLAFAKGAFDSNPYQESPNLRGLWVSGAIKARELKIGELKTGEVNKSKDRGLFLNQLFTEILPAERSMVSTLSKTELAGSFTRRFIMGGWGILVILAFVFLSFTFWTNLNYLKEKTGQSMGTFVNNDIETISHLQEMIIEISRDVDQWWIPWFMEMDEPDFITQMKFDCTEKFRRYQLIPADEKLAKNLAEINSLPSTETARIAGTLASRINTLEAFFQKTDEDTLLSLPLPFPERDIYFDDKISYDSLDTFNRVYIRSLTWTEDKEPIQNELKHLRTHLTNLLKNSKNGFAWVIPLANEKIGMDAKFSLSYYWIGSGTLNPDIQILPAYTLSGKAFIDDYIGKLIATDPDSSELNELKTNFYETYKAEYLDTWKNFAMNFDLGIQTLRSRKEWVAMIDLIASNYNPYFKVLDLMAEQLAPFSEEEDLPEWLEVVNYFQQMKAYDPNVVDTKRYDNKVKQFAMDIVSKFGSIGKTLGKGGKKGLRTNRRLTKPETKDEKEKVLKYAGQELGEYRKALINVAFNAESSEASFKAMQRYFINPDDPGDGDGPGAAAYQSVRKLQSFIGKERDDNEAFWRLYAGPLKIFHEYMVRETACELQKKWEDNFLVEIEGVPEYKLNALMFGQEGKVWTFLEKDTSAFLTRKYGKGYVPVRVQDNYMPFNSKFINFISRNRDNAQTRPESVTVNISALPVHANEDAKILPSATMLKLICPDKAQVLGNYNFAISKTFEWSDQCGELLFSIEIGNLTLKKIYSGTNSFANFLKEFRSGIRRFTPDDFPGDKDRLSEMNIRYIDVEYRITGQEPVVSTLNATTIPIPMTIISCWPEPPPVKYAGKKLLKTEKPSDKDKNTGIYSAQTASFIKKDQAVKLARDLQQKGYSPRIFWLKDSRDKTWFTVHIGTDSLRSNSQDAAIKYNKNENASINVRKYKIDLINQRNIDF